MKVYNRITYVWDKDKREFVEESSNSYEYSGPVAEAKGGGQQTQTVNNDPWSGQQPYLRDLFRGGQNLFQQGAPSTARSGAALDNYIAELGQAGQAVRPLAGQTYDANKFLLGDVLRPESNPALQSYIDLSNQSITDAFTQNVLPQLTSGAAAGSGVGGSRQGVVEALSAKNLMDTLQRNTAQLTSQGYGQGLSAYTKGLALTPQTAGVMGLPADYAQQSYAAHNVAEMTPFNREMELLNAYKSIIGGGGYGGQQTTSTPYESGGLTGALGGGAAGAGIASALPKSMASWNPWIIGAGALAGYLS